MHGRFQQRWFHIGDTAPVDERLQKFIDQALYAGGNPEAQKLRNFLNGPWLGEPFARRAD